ncbi:hypothetical protein [Brevundimonas sp.]|uniref:hypothetical protein n=1 Tax=Brevundimonas sp. TaxID=1871086 RepID=UPI00122A1FB9|nr:hypothetical protein [Brevundimonas sp.]TAJ60654.1 MAG: hypothetical protein EPO49_09005 [Brevundimonas sp.]
MDVLDNGQDGVEGIPAARLPALGDAIQKGQKILAPLKRLGLQGLGARRAAHRDRRCRQGVPGCRNVEKGAVQGADIRGGVDQDVRLRFPEPGPGRRFRERRFGGDARLAATATEVRPVSFGPVEFMSTQQRLQWRPYKFLPCDVD